ncbi:DUF1707 SHOCT-like domain-containing protein [Spirochaeta lutea]|uniref:DUF1707 domain-containing protein n=1 Tax=Spirochaeta lutea TaxID=1480694 RepID=A0A098QW21_9SPIO|nr:DUF1707 domain-containing protein [Spirochaeta lutea]KGE71864.1 hypothetical protein DC28_08545 [Spirochaeta lutea]
MEKERDQIIDHLSNCFARDLLTAEDFELRVERAHQASTLDQLAGLIEDLPTLPGSPRFAAPSGSHSRFPSGDYAEGRGEGSPGPYRGGFPGDLEPETTYAIFSEQKLAGNWLRRNSAAATVALGSMVMDLRDVTLGPYTEIQLTAFMGEITIILPDYPVLVESSVSTILAEFKRKGMGRAPDNAPLLKLKGYAVLSQITLKQKR